LAAAASTAINTKQISGFQEPNTVGLSRRTQHLRLLIHFADWSAQQPKFKSRPPLMQRRPLFAN
jgi:hypothetical protein